MSANGFKPLKHGARFVCLFDGMLLRFRMRSAGRKMDPTRAIDGAWIYGDWLCIAHMEGLTWARGWNTKAARALRVACAL